MVWEAWDKRGLGLPKSQALRNLCREGICPQGPLLTPQGREWQQEPGSVSLAELEPRPVT